MKQVMSQQVKDSDKVVVAIDPGESGGIAICAGRKVSAANLDETLTAELLHQLVIGAGADTYQITAMMEQVGGYIGKEQPGSAMFNFGNGYGYWRGYLKAQGIPLQLVPPQRWMRAVAPGVLGMEYGERKRALKALAQHWYPELEVTLRTADALCLLRYAMQGGPGNGDPVAMESRSRADWPKDSRGFRKWFKSQKNLQGQGIPMPKGQELYTAINWWVEQGRPGQ